MPDAQGHAEAVEQARRLRYSHRAQVQTQDFTIEKGEGLVGVIQSIDGVLLGAGDVFEEADDLRGFQFARMALLMKEDIVLRPVTIPFGWFWAPEAVCAAERSWSSNRGG